MVDPLSLGMYALIILMVVFMIRNSRKQKQAREELNSKIVSGVQVMTTAGIFGTIVSVNDDENEIVLESTPGTKLRMHRQSIASIVTKAEEPADSLSKSSAKSTKQSDAT